MIGDGVEGVVISMIALVFPDVDLNQLALATQDCGQ
jgi:hypothetical protein